MPGPGPVTQNPRPAGAWIPRVNVSGAARPNTALPGRAVEVDQPRGPRNPIVRALVSLGRLLTCCCTRSQPTASRNLSPEQRAALKTRTRLVKMFQRLATPQKKGASAKQQAVAGRKAAPNIAEDLRVLTADHARRAQSSHGTQPEQPLDEQERQHQADQELDHAIREVLDSQWPGEQALVLAESLSREYGADAVHGSDPDSERILTRIKACVAQVILERAYATIEGELSNTLTRIRDEALPMSIRTQAENAIGTAGAIFAQLNKQGLLGPEGTDSSEQLARFLQERIAGLGASEQELTIFVRHLEPASLKKLEAKKPADIEIANALRTEIDARMPRLIAQLDREVNDKPTVAGRPRAGTILTTTLDDEMSRIYLLHQEIKQHNILFGIRIPEEFRTLTEAFDAQIAGVLEARIRSTGKGTELRSAAATATKLLPQEIVQQLQKRVNKEIEEQKKKAENAVVTVLDQLSAKQPEGRAAGYLTACKDLVNTLQYYLLAAGVDPAEVEKPEKLANKLSELVGSLPEAYADRAAAMLQALGAPEMRALRYVLSQAADRAADADLPELHAELKRLSATFEVVAGAVERLAGRNVSPRGTPDLRPLDMQLRELLEEMCSTRITPEGQVKLTAGRCGEKFTAVIRQEVEKPFSATEESSIMLAGVWVPQQFEKDAKRDGTIFLGSDGEPLVDRRDWNKLTEAERDERIAAGYLKLLKFYGGNEKQTEAIVRLANQATTASFLTAQLLAPEDSPVELEGYGRGVLNAPPMNTHQRTIVRFFMSDTLRPQMELSQEYRGGRLDLIDAGAPSGDAVYLDRQKSHARFTLTVEADAAQKKLTLVGTPTYDVHLVRSPIQQPFAIAKLADLFATDPAALYDALRSYAERTGQMDGSNALHAMEKISRWEREPSNKQHPAMVYADHLAPDAKLALPETAAVRVARESFENARELTLHIFDAAEAAARERLARPEPAASGARHALQEFLNSVEDFKANPQRTLDDARAIIGAFPPSPVDIEPTVASSSAAVVAESSSAPASEPGAEQFPLPSEALIATYDAFNNAATFLNNDVRAAMNHLLKTQLTPIATGLLPLFNAELLAHAKQHPEPVNLGV